MSELYDNTPPDLKDLSHAGTLAWACLAAGVVVYDVFASETLSAACKRGIDNKYSRPFVLGAIALTGSHLACILPERVDPFKALLTRAKALAQT